MKHLFQKHRYTILLALAFLAAGLSLYALFKIAYNGDDVINSYVNGALLGHNRTIRTHTNIIRDIWFGNGRFFPLSFYATPLFSTFSTLFSYRLFLVVLNLLVIGAFARLVALLTRDRIAVILSVTLFPIFLQLRYYHDPVVSFHGLLQFVALFLFLAMIFQIQGIQKRKNILLILSAVFYLVCLMLYEISLTFIVIFVLLAILFKGNRFRVRNILFHFAALGIVLAVTFYLRSTATASYGGTTLSLDIVPALRTFGIQLLAAIPLLNSLGSLRSLFSGDYFRPYHIFLFGSLAIAVLSSFIIMAKRSENQSNSSIGEENINLRQKSTLRLFLVGLALWMLPATLIAVSERYQNELRPGLGYLPVYIQIFGGICIALACISFLFLRIRKQRARKISASVLAGFFAFAAIPATFHNNKVGQLFTENNVQTLSIRALESGLMDDIPTEIPCYSVMAGTGADMDPFCFFASYTGEVRSFPSFEAVRKDSVLVEETDTLAIYSPIRDIYAYFAHDDLTGGTAAVARIDTFAIDKETDQMYYIASPSAKIFVIGEPTDTLKWDCIDSDSGTFSLTLEEILESNGNAAQWTPLSDSNYPTQFIDTFLLDRGSSRMIEITNSEEMIILTSIRLE